MTTATTPTTPQAMSPFRRRTIIALVSVGVASLAIALFLAAFADDFTEREPTAETNGYSRSAIGYEALIELLQELDIPVLVSQDSSARRAGDGLLVLFAPDLYDEQAKVELRETVGRARRVLLVLPRWWGLPAEEDKGWIEERHELYTEDSEELLRELRIAGKVASAQAPLRVDVPWLTAPTIATPQLVHDHDLTPLVTVPDEGAVLLGRTRYDDDTEVWVLADPSPLDNAGLRVAGNPEFAVALIDHLRQDGPVVFDETTHGFVETPSLWKKLVQFPLVLVTIHVLLSTIVLLWAAVGRFGPPRAAAPPMASGKDFLIRNTADLLHVGGHDAEALIRYLATTIAHVRSALHAPLELDPAQLRVWLERVRSARGGTIALPELERDVYEAARAPRSGAASRRLVEMAARVHRWRTEMTHGPHHHP